MKTRIIQLKHSLFTGFLLAGFLYGTEAKAQGACSASFTFNISSGGDTVYFQNTSAGSFTYQSWNFGDGSTSTSNAPSHTYPIPGIYYVCLTISDQSSGCQSTFCDTVVIGNGGNSCSVFFGYSLIGLTANFISSFSGAATAFQWDFGDGTSSTLQNPSHVYTQSGTYNVCLTAYDISGNPCGQYCTWITIGQQIGTDTLCGHLFNDPNGNGIFDTGDSPITQGSVWIYGNGIQLSAAPDPQGFYYVAVPPGTYTVYYCTGSWMNVFTIPLNTDTGSCAYYYQVTVAPGQNLCGLDFGVQQSGVLLEGKVFMDTNNNGVLDAGEYGIPYQEVQVNGLSIANTDLYGNYSVHKTTGTHTLTFTPSGWYAGLALTTPSSIIVNASAAGVVYGGNNFGINVPSGLINLAVEILPVTNVVPGFPTHKQIVVHNVGSMPMAANLTMVYDPSLTFNSAYPVQATHNASTQTITWNLPLINPGSHIYVFASFQASTSLSIGDLVHNYVQVSPSSGTDIDLSNNQDSLTQVVVGSWDPNNKLSIKTNSTIPNQQIISTVNSNQEIEYVINFQNLGNAPAVNIVVTDELSSDLVANTFKLVSTSHNCTVTRTGSVVNYNFSGIMLPPSSSNEPASHGSVAFKINAVNGLPAGHVISDFAAIYFDFNSPVITNVAEVTMINPLTVLPVFSVSSTFSVYPNPVHGNTWIRFQIESDDDAQFVLHDASGKAVRTMFLKNQQAGNYQMEFDTKGLEKGIYLLSMRCRTKEQHVKISVF